MTHYIFGFIFLAVAVTPSVLSALVSKTDFVEKVSLLINCASVAAAVHLLAFYH